MTREWEEYKDGPTDTSRERLHITLNQRCVILLNKNVFAALGSPTNAMLLFDRRNQTIGIRPAVTNDQKPFPVRSHVSGTHYYIHAKPFCRRYNIIPGKNVRFTTPEIDHNGFLILDLHHTEPVQKKNRTSKAAA